MIKIMINGLPGNMGQIVAETALEKALALIPYSLTGQAITEDEFSVKNQNFKLLKPDTRQEVIEQIKKEHGNFIAIDYTHPSAVNENAEFYVRNGIPFVMGTTGGDREALMDLVEKASHSCVIAPNMAKQIVAFQALMEMWAQEFPQTFAAYDLSVVESHQKTKADTSGTAKAVCESLLKLGPDLEHGEIQLVRTEDAQLKMGVPQEHLKGHAFHTYGLTSPDKSVHFEFQHNVCGRKVYAEGTIDAAIFLHQQIQKNSANKCFSMVDVLRAGAMD
ncbi:MAG: dihydrodipicolinate reductase [Fibrobacter sp.]|nr:dihydrodipicolinate reductase [Fibrobacter sp.]